MASEKTLESRLVKEVKARGGICLKQTSQYHRGIPDRLIILPSGRTLWAELKTTGRKPTLLQAKTHEELQQLGQSVFVVDDERDLLALLNYIDDIRTSGL